MKRFFVLVLAVALAVPALAADVDDYVGTWALTLPGDGVGWLGIDDEGSYLAGSIMWSGGSVHPLASVYMDDDDLVFTRIRTVERKDGDEVVLTQTFTDTYVCSVDGDDLAITVTKVRGNGQGTTSQDFSGTRNAPLPPAPNLSKIEYGDPITLFNGKNLNGWKLTNDRQVNGWKVVDGVLVNDPKQEEGKKHIRYGNLQTEDEFEDFNLTCEVNVPEKGNSGIYLRGIYEVQVMDSYGMDRDPHHMGGIYSRITPAVAAEKPAGEWQTYDITLADRHVTVILNGKTIIDNAPLEGITGGAMTQDEFSPGPIYLQGDHTGVSYRNMVLRPRVK